MQVTTTLSRASQITIPSAMRKKLGLEFNDPVDITLKKNTIVIQKAESQADAIQRIFSELDSLRREHERHMTPEQKSFAKQSTGWTIDQYHKHFDNLPETQKYLKEKYSV